LITRLDLDRFEQVLLAVFFVVLPGYEAPKNIVLWSFLIYWTIRRLRFRDGRRAFGGSNWYFDGPLVAIAAVGVISSMRAIDPVQSAVDSLDFLTIALLAIALRRTTISREQFLVGLATIFLGITLALADGYFRRGLGFPTLHSVGHINHVAIYLATAAAAALAIAWRAMGVCRLAGFIAFCLLAWVALKTNSRNTAFGLLGLLLLLAGLALYVDKCKRLTLLIFGLSIFALGLAAVIQPTIYMKQLRHLESGSLDKPRAKILRTAWVVGAERPFFGHGVGQWRAVTQAENVRRIVTENGEIYNSKNFFVTTHGHNLAATWYVERGACALFLLGFFVVYCITSMLRATIQNPRAIEPAVGLVVLVATLLYGVGNTPLHHEHGLLALAMIALGIQRLEPGYAVSVEG
jgi:O-antigen ligase